MPGLGDEFRAAREARHLSLSDVSEQIHIRSVYLQSIEDEQWAAIAAPVYVRGFIRTYARFLGLEPETAVERFNAEMGDAVAREPQVVKQIGTRRGPSPWLWVAIAVAVVLVAFVGYKALDSGGAGGVETQVAATAAPGTPVPSAVASASASASGADVAGPGGPAPAGGAAPGAAGPAGAPKPDASAKAGRTLVLSVQQTSWMLVAIDGAKVAEGIFPAGTVKTFHGKSASLRVGNAGGVDVIVNGKDRGLLGNPGSVVDKTILLAE